MNFKNLLFILSISILGMSSCANTKMAKYMEAHNTAFQNAISGNLSQEEKLDVVANSLVTALEEAMTYGTIRKSVRHIDQFSKKNEKSLNILLKDLSGWTNNMSPAEKIMMVPKIAGKSYTKRLIDVVPKFEKKVKRRITTFKIASKIVGLVKPNLF